MRTPGILLLLLCCLTSLFGQDIPAPSQTAWEEFRTLRPFPFQFIVWDEPSNTLIVSEVPAEFSSRKLERWLRKEKLEATVFESTFSWGQGGQFRDLIIALSLETERSPEAIASRLEGALFPEANGRRLAALNTLRGDLSIPTAFHQSYPGNFYTWVQESSGWIDEQGLSHEGTTLLETGNPGCFSGPGAVKMLLLSRRDPTDPVLWEYFLSETDLILGGAWSDTRLAVLARTREVPAERLAPLREETVRLLQGLPEVRSILESRNPLAGSFGESSYWAPWYTSPGLADTELSALLLLSESIRIDYLSGGKYQLALPVLGEWTYAPNVQPSMIHTTPWTTEGAYYHLVVDSLHWLGRSLTGGLPLKNLAQNTRFWNGPPKANPAGEVEVATSLASVGHPVLIRTAEYAFLHQLFRQAGLLEVAAPPIQRPQMTATVREVFAEVRSRRQEEWTPVAEQVARDRLGDDVSTDDPRMAKLWTTTTKRVERELKGSAFLMRQTLDSMEVNYGESGMDYLAQAMVLPAPYAFPAKDRADSLRNERVRLAAQSLGNGFRIIASGLVDPKVVRNELLSSMELDREGVVLTPPLVDLQIVAKEGGKGELELLPWGGSSWPVWKTSLVVDATQATGTIRIKEDEEGHRTAIFHPEDMQKVDREILNWLERPVPKNNLRQKIASMLAERQAGEEGVWR